MSRRCLSIRQDAYGPRQKNGLKDVADIEDICQFYQNKALRLQEKYSDLWDLLEDLKQSCSSNAELQSDLVARTAEVSKLQLAVSDLQVFLFREREENLRLSAENDELRIENYENSRALDILLQLSGITPKQLTDLLTTHSNLSKDKSKGSSNSNRDNNAAVNSGRERRATKDALLMQVKSLETQLENLRTLFRNEVDVLLKDREVMADERAVETRRAAEQLNKLSSNFRMAQQNLTETAACLLACEKEKERELELFVRDRIIIQKKERNLENDENTRPVILSGVGSARIRGGNNRLLQARITELEKLSNLYHRQCKNLEEETKKWRDKAERAEKLLKDKSQKLTSDLTVMRHRYEELDRRRLSEAEGFRSDVKLLRERIKELDKKISKMKAEEEAANKVPNEDLKLSTQQTLERAKLFEREVSDLRRKVAALSKEELFH